MKMGKKNGFFFVFCFFCTGFCVVVCMFTCCLRRLREREDEIALYTKIENEERKRRRGWILQEDDFEHKKK